MEARAATGEGLIARTPVWALGLVPLALIALVVGLLALLDGPGLGERVGPPAEELAVERTVLRPGEIELTVRNDGPDPVSVSQVAINDAFVPFQGAGEVGRLGSSTLTIPYPWTEEEDYELFLLTATGLTIDHDIEGAVVTPTLDLDFFGLMALLGLYVGIIPVSIGMIWLPFVRRVGEHWLRILIAFTVGLLAFLGIDALLEGVEIAGEAPQAFGGPGLVVLGAVLAYLALAGIDAHLRERGERAVAAGGARGAYLALLVAIGIGLHNLGEGLAIGSAYAGGLLALGAFLVIGFALHNTTEGLAIVAPLGGERPRLRRLVGFGLIAGAPVIAGAWIGAAAPNDNVIAFLLGVGAGAIVQVIVQLAPAIRDRAGRILNPGAVGGLVAGLLVLYATGLLIPV